MCAGETWSRPTPSLADMRWSADAHTLRFRGTVHLPSCADRVAVGSGTWPPVFSRQTQYLMTLRPPHGAACLDLFETPRPGGFPFPFRAERLERSLKSPAPRACCKVERVGTSGQGRLLQRSWRIQGGYSGPQNYQIRWGLSALPSDPSLMSGGCQASTRSAHWPGLGSAWRAWPYLIPVDSAEPRHPSANQLLLLGTVA